LINLGLDVGVATILLFARSGCEHIFIGDSDVARLEKTRALAISQHPSVQVHLKAFDRSSEYGVEKFFAAVADSLGRIDFAVNVVSQAQDTATVTGLSVEKYDRCYLNSQRGVSVTQGVSRYRLLLTRMPLVK
jgi:NAD(P)-dependent dehydrogenase (short-subunit alcohol dehydrogenase family)